MNKLFNFQFSYKLFCVLFIGLITNSCQQKDTNLADVNTLFTLVNNEESNITFKNEVKENLYFNFINYPYIYNGGGVAVGDINNDGLEDIYFTSNQNSNKLYLNKGDFEFEDITDKALVSDSDGWTTGVTFVDINADGFLDIYVCKSGSLKNAEQRKNKLFINQQNNTFKESAVNYGLDHFGFSVQAYFFDFDNDNDLDMYLVNHREDFQNNTFISEAIQKNILPQSSDQLFRNDEGRFVNITNEAGISNKAWGLSAAIGDFNDDNLPDIYVANDFLQPDFLYINNGDGAFKNNIETYFKHTAHNSMGSDFADINNDLNPDLIVLDMLAEDHIRGKENMATMSTENFWALVNSGYHYQYMANVLQLNNSNNSFSEIGQLAGISKTDWSWAPLLADFDNDGFNDLFVTNGIEHDLSNQDFRNQMKNNIRARKKVTLDEAINMMPSAKLRNYIFRNAQNLTFKNKTENWGFNQKINSNGAAYSDLDNDGDLDLILNNQGELASIYKNNAQQNFLTFQLKGPKNNPNGVGAKVVVYAQNLQQSKVSNPSRGFQSSVTPLLHFGLDSLKKVDSVKVVWNNQKQQTLIGIDINKKHLLKYSNATLNSQEKRTNEPFFDTINPIDLGIDFQQKENQFNDFNFQLLLPQKQSEMSSPLVVADVNNDGLDDFFVGNALGAPAALYIQNNNGTFRSSNNSLFEKEKHYEDTDALFIDVDNDEDLDLYVTSGGYELDNTNALLQDRIYLNNGTGKFTKSTQFLPNIKSNSKGICKADIDNDGDLDVFIGSRVIHKKYPLAEKPVLLQNNDGKYTNVTAEKIQFSEEITMVNDAIFSDYDNDGDPDLLIVGEWMSVQVYENNQGTFTKKTIPILNNTNGWYQSIEEVDFDNDGFKDYIVGNWGNNNKFHPTTEKPLHVYADYLDANKTFDVVLSKVSKTGDILPVRGRECSSQQVPMLTEKVGSFKEFAALTLPDIYGEEALRNATHYQAHTFETFVLKNLKNGTFKKQTLPVEAQFGPTLSTVTLDINNDGYLDIFGVGNIYEAEVETIRYDASQGYVLLGAKNGEFHYLKDTSYFNKNEAKCVAKININDTTHIIILNKNTTLTILKVLKK